MSSQCMLCCNSSSHLFWVHFLNSSNYQGPVNRVCLCVYVCVHGWGAVQATAQENSCICLCFVLWPPRLRLRVGVNLRLFCVCMCVCVCGWVKKECTFTSVQCARARVAKCVCMCIGVWKGGGWVSKSRGRKMQPTVSSWGETGKTWPGHSTHDVKTDADSQTNESCFNQFISQDHHKLRWKKLRMFFFFFFTLR